MFGRINGTINIININVAIDKSFWHTPLALPKKV